MARQVGLTDGKVEIVVKTRRDTVTDLEQPWRTQLTVTMDPHDLCWRGLVDYPDVFLYMRGVCRGWSPSASSYGPTVGNPVRADLRIGSKSCHQGINPSIQSIGTWLQLKSNIRPKGPEIMSARIAYPVLTRTFLTVST